MKGIDLITAVSAVALVGGSIWYHICRKKAGKTGCAHCEGCGCASRGTDEGDCRCR